MLALPKVPFSFSSMAAGSSRTQVLVRSACIEDRRELVLVVRVHDVDLGAGTGVSVVAVAAAPTREQPEVDFASDEILASVAIEGTSAGTLLRSMAVAPLPSHVQLQIRATQAGSQQTMTATLGVELSGKH